MAGEVPAERLASLSTVDLIAQYDLAISTYAGRGTSTSPRQGRINRIVDLLDARADAGDADALAWYGKTSRRTAKDPRFDGVGLKQDDDGYYVTTHRARSDSYPTPEDIPDSVIAEIEATGMRTTAARKTAERVTIIFPNGQVGQGEVDGDYAVLDSPAGATIWLREDGLAFDPTNGSPLGTWSKTAAATQPMTFDQGGRQVAPAAVDTLRDEQCPVCGETDAYDGDNCSVCGFVKPPEEFGDPDLSKAQQTDLRQDAEEQAGQRLVCPDCGASFVGGTKVAVILDRERGADDSTDVTYAAGDTCPECGKGVLQAQAEDLAAEVDEDGFAPAGSAAETEEPDPDFGDDDITEDDVLEDDEDDTETSTESEDSEDEDDDDKPDFLKKKKPTAARRGSDSTRRSTVEMARPALEALREQQGQIAVLARQNLMLRDALVAVASLAGLGNHPRIAALIKRAEDENPAYPDGWATSNTGTEAPAVTTEEAKAPQATDNPESIGASPLTDVTPDATTSVTDRAPVLDEPLSLNEQDPTQPVAGAETLGDGAAGQSGTNRVETDVRIGTPSQEPAFDDASFTASARPIAAMRLARLRIEAGIAEETDDLTLSAKIASSDVTDDAIRSEIDVLSKVVAVRPAVPGQAPARTAPRRLVPQSTHQAVRAVPSLTAEAAVGSPEVSTPVSPDEIVFG